MTSNILALLAVLAATALPAGAQESYPYRAVRIVTSTPGNFHDVVARRMAEILGGFWKQPIVVENRGGVGMVLATTAVAQAAADGYTLLLTDRSALAVQPSLQSKLPYDPLKDLTPITLVGAAPMLIIADPAVPAGTFADFIAYLRRSSAPVPFSSAGPGTANHLAGEVLKQTTGANIMSVHYKGAPASMMGLLGGDTKAAFMLVSVGLPQVRAGRVKVFAITSRTRFAGAPDVPTVRELGMPALEAELWLALMGPAGMQPATVATIRRQVLAVLADASFRATLESQGASVAQSTPEELTDLIRSETARWKRVIEVANIKAE